MGQGQVSADYGGPESALLLGEVRELGMPMPFAFHEDWEYQPHRSSIQSPAAKRLRRQGTAVCSKPNNLTALYI